MVDVGKKDQVCPLEACVSLGNHQLSSPGFLFRGKSYRELLMSNDPVVITHQVLEEISTRNRQYLLTE